jgi:hypothetical protein
VGDFWSDLVVGLLWSFWKQCFLSSSNSFDIMTVSQLAISCKITWYWLLRQKEHKREASPASSLHKETTNSRDTTLASPFFVVFSWYFWSHTWQIDTPTYWKILAARLQNTRWSQHQIYAQVVAKL